MQSASSINITRLIPQPLRQEGYRLKDYIKNRYVDITYNIKAHPFLMVAVFLVVAAAIYSLGAVKCLLCSLVHYLDNTYCRHSLCQSLAHLDDIFWNPLTNPEKCIEGKQDEDPKLAELIWHRNELRRLRRRQEKLREQHDEYQGMLGKNPRPIALFLRAKDDHNGAFKEIDYSVRIDRDLSQKYKIILIDNISKVDQIADGLKVIADKRVQQVWFLAHGTPTAMFVDGKNKIGDIEVDSLKELMQEKLADNANVILFSCSTGAPLSKEDNIAIKVSKALPGRTIWAPTAPFGISTMEIKRDHSCRVEIFDVISRLQYLKTKIVNCFRLQPFEKIEPLINLTAQFKDGKRVVSP